MSERYFPLSFFNAGVTYAAALGVSADPLLEAVGISPGLLADPSAVITATQYHEVTVQAQRMLNDPAFALHLGEWILAEATEIVGPLYLTAPTLRDSLKACVRFMPLVSPCLDSRLEEDGDEAAYVCDIIPELRDDYRFLHAEATLSITWRLIRIVSGRLDACPRRILLRHDGSERLSEFRRLFGPDVEILFNADRDATIFDRALLDLPNPASSPRIHAQMEKMAQARLAALPTVETVSARVLRLLEGQVGQRVMDLDDIAEMMGVSARTLQRRLSEEHTSFQKLHDGLRYRLACELLRRPDADIPTIAATLGFSEPATFHRAFRQWSGVSVTDYRRRPAAGDATSGVPAD